VAPTVIVGHRPNDHSAAQAARAARRVAEASQMAPAYWVQRAALRAYDWVDPLQVPNVRGQVVLRASRVERWASLAERLATVQRRHHQGPVWANGVRRSSLRHQ